MLHILLTLSIVFLVVYGTDAAGVSRREIVVRVNETFSIKCFLDVANGSLNFYNGDELIPSEYITLIDDKTIELNYLLTKATKTNLTCRKNGESNVGDTLVRVAEEVEPVKNFTCVTTNLTTVTCSFKQPESFTAIKYRLRFSLNSENKKHKFDIKGDGKHGYSGSIILPNENLSDLSLHFVLNGSNKFFSRKEHFSMKLMEILLPRKLEEMKVEDSTTHNSSIVTFMLPKELKPVSNEMTFDVRLEDEHNRKNWRKISHPRLQVKGLHGFLALDGLEYANTAYRVKLRAKAKIAMDVDEFWSPSVEVAFVTKPTVPEKIPETCRNCFNVMDNGDVVVYWTAVEKKHQNADNFFYRVRGIDENGKEIFHKNFSDTSLILQREFEAETIQIEIRTINEKGISRNFSFLSVPMKKLNSNKILNIHKQIDDKKYKISWTLPDNVDADSFTVVSCRQRNELPNQCDGPVTLNHLKNNAKEYFEDAKNSKQFGVAVNLRNKTIAQGFEWASCTAAKENEIGQVHSFWGNSISEHSVTLQWQLNCVDYPIFAGINVTFCPADDNDECNEPIKSDIALDEKATQFELKNLKAFTRYKISLALLSRTRHGVFKTPIIVKTLETAPTAPQNLQVLKISQHSVELSWQRPRDVNGDSMTYQLWYNDHKININNNHTMNETFTYRLDGLEAFTKYTITVVACTSFCSESNDNLKITTSIGQPSTMLQPQMESMDDGSVVISWIAPKILGGKLDYFQLIASLKDGNAKIYRINGHARSCVIRKMNCDSGKVDFAIRGVNVEKELTESLVKDTVECFEFREVVEGEISGYFYGDWSEVMAYYCQDQYSMVAFGIISIVVLLLLVAFVYLFIRLYQKIKFMKDIHIVWPKGLDPDSLNSSPSKKENNHDAIKDLDLIKDHVLTDIDEEEEKEIEKNDENEKFLEDKKFLENKKFQQPDTFVVVSEKTPEQRESAKSELFLPFICNPKTNEVFYTMPKMSTSETTSPTISLPSSQLASPTDYMKMYAPVESRVTSPVEGYIDMSGGKSPATPSTPAKEPDYLDNGVKLFIKDSEIHNNGYIGKRASVVTEAKKPAVFVNANGYVGLKN